MGYKSPSLRPSIGLLVSLLSLTAVAADVELQESYQSSKSETYIKEISDLKFLEDGSLISVDSYLGALVRFNKGEATPIVISGKDKPFKSKKVTGVAVVSGKQLAVGNSGDDKVALLSLQGEVKSHFGASGSGAGLLKSPHGLAHSHNNRIYIADEAGYISVFSSTGVFLYSIGNDDADELKRLKRPTHVALDNQEHIYVLDSADSGSVHVYTQAGKRLKIISSNILKSTTNGKKIQLSAIAVDQSGRLFIADKVSGKVMQYDWRGDKVVLVFGSAGKGPGQYKDPTALAISNDNRIAVADSGNDKLDIYKLPGAKPKQEIAAPYASVNFAGKVGLPCTTAYELNNSHLLCLDTKKDTASILDPSGQQIKALGGKINNPIQASFDNEKIVVLGSKGVFVFNYDGKQITQFGSPGSKDGQLKGATDVFLAGKRIYVSEAGSKRVQFFTQKGVFVGRLPRPGDSPELLLKPAAVSVNSQGEIFVADNLKKKIVVFSANNQFMYEIGASAKTPNAFTEIQDLAVDVDDNLYVLTGTEQNEQTVEVYSGKQKLFRFGNYSKKEDSALVNAKALTLTPKQKTSIAIFDATKKAMQNYHYIKVPSKVKGLKVTGNVGSADLIWSEVPGKHIKEYRVYGAQSLNGPYELIESTDKTMLNVSQSTTSYSYYRVSAVSGFDKEGLASTPAEDIFLEAYLAYKKGEFDTTQKVLTVAVETNPEHAAAVKYLGLSYRQEQKTESALRQFRALSQLPAHREEGLKLQVAALYENKQYIEALAVVQELIKSAKTDPDAQLYCGRLSLEMNDGIGAVTCLEEAVALQAGNIEAQLLLGRAYIKVGAEDQGYAQIEKALSNAEKLETSEKTQLWVEAGEIFVQQEQLDQATEKFQKALEIDAANTQAQLGLAKVLLKQEKLDEVRSIAISLAGQTDTLSEGNYLLGVIALANNDEGSALLALGKASRADAQNVPAWIALSDVYRKRGDNDRALQTLKTLSENNQENFDAQLAYGQALLAEGKGEEASKPLKIALDINPNSFDARLTAAQAGIHSGGLKQAESNIQQAIRIAPKSIDALLVKADIQQKQGKTGDALESVRKAIELEKTDARLQVRLAKLYLENSLYDQALEAIDQALILDPKSSVAYVAQGDLYTQRRLYEAAIESYEKAAEITPTPENKSLVNAAYAQKKKSEDFRYNQPQLVLENLKLNPVFSAAYKQYTDTPVGTIVVRNAAATDYGNLSLSFNIKDYMDFPSSTPINMVAGGQSVELPLKAAFNNQVLNIDEDTGVQVEIKLNFVRNGQKDSIAITRPMTIHGKNAITWSQPNMVGSFVTPKDDSLRSFVRQSINQYKPEHGPLSESLVSAMTLFNSFNALGIKYVVDPSNPFAELTDEAVDYVQFSRETLKLKSGDCDDLSILLSTGLENLGIATALLDVPGHLLMMFNTGIPEKDRTVISQQEKLVVIRDGTVWVPIEATMISTSFAEAWAEGARKYHQFEQEKKLSVIAMKDAWQHFQPVTLAHSEHELELPPANDVQALVKVEINRLIEQGIDRITLPYQRLLEGNPKDEVAKTQMAIVYAKYGLTDRAQQTISELLELNPRSSEAYNTQGNIHLNSGEYDQAVQSYQKAEDLDAKDGGIKINMSIAYYKAGELSSARNKYQEAIDLNNQLAQRYEGLGSLLAN